MWMDKAGLGKKIVFIIYIHNTSFTAYIHIFSGTYNTRFNIVLILFKFNHINSQTV